MTGCSAFSGERGHPVRELAGQRRQRQRAVADELVVELAEVECRAVPGRDLAPQSLDLALADLVGQGLGRPADVPICLDYRVGLGDPGLDKLIDGLLARPAEAG